MSDVKLRARKDFSLYKPMLTKYRLFEGFMFEDSSRIESEAGDLFGLPIRTATTYVLLFVLAFGIYASLWPGAPVMEPDSHRYLSTARDLADLHLDELQLRAPGYPLLLVATGSSHTPNRTLFFLSLFLHFASIWLLASVLYSNGVKSGLLILFGLILLSPSFVEIAGYVLSENLAAATLVLGFVGLTFWSQGGKLVWIIISASAFGYAALTRPTYQLLAIGIAGYLLIIRTLFNWSLVKQRNLMIASVVLVCGSIFFLGGYSWINYRSVGYFGITPKLGLTLSQKTLRVIERLPEEYLVIKDVLVKARNARLTSDPSHTGFDYIWPIVPELKRITRLEYPELSAYMLRLNLILIQKAPLNYLQEVLWASVTYWFPSSGELANFNSRGFQLFLAVSHFCLMTAVAINLVLLVGAGIYVEVCRHFLIKVVGLPVVDFSLIRFQWLIYGLASAIVLYTAVISCLVEIGNARFRVPTDALIVFMLFLGSQLWRRMVELARVFLTGARRDFA
jgi:hypothetical protein